MIHFKNASILSGIILLLCCYSCTRNYSTMIGLQEHSWDCTYIKDNKLNLDQFLKIQNITGLEECNSSMIGAVNKLIHEDSLFIIMDNDLAKKIFVFGSDGKFISNIGSSGSGPDDFIQLNDVSYDPSEKILYLLCNYNKILGYDLNGRLQKKMETPFRMINMEIYGDKFFFVSEDPAAYEAIVCDRQLNILSAFFPNNTKKIGHRLVHALQKTPDEGVSFYRYLDNNIYNLSTSRGDSIEVKYAIDFGVNKIDRTTIEGLDEKSIKAEKASKRGHIKYFAETNDFATIVFFDGNTPCISFYNRNTDESQSFFIQNISEDFVGTIYSPLEYSNGNKFLQVVDDCTYSEYRNNKSVECGDNPLIISLDK